MAELAHLSAAAALLLSACGEPSTELPTLEHEPVPNETATDYALEFDGDNQYATSATSYFPIANISQSITAWILPQTQEGDVAFFTMRRESESGTELGLSDGRVTAWSVWGMRVFAQAEESIEAGVWHHVAHVQIRVEAEEPSYEQRLYLDGELVAEGDQPPQSRTPTSSWFGSFDGASMQYLGLLDDLTLYARALSPEEIAASASGAAVDAEALVAKWSFDEDPASSVAYDRSGRGNHATLGDGVSELMPARVPR